MDCERIAERLSVYTRLVEQYKRALSTLVCPPVVPWQTIPFPHLFFRRQVSVCAWENGPIPDVYPQEVGARPMLAPLMTEINING